MIFSIKKSVLSGLIMLFVCFTAYAINKSIDLDGWSLLNSSPNLIHTCDPTTHTHESYVTHHENYDKYVESCINKETKEYSHEEYIAFHNETNTPDLNPSSHHINNNDSLTFSHDSLNDSTLETRKQGIEENQTAQIEAQDKSFQITGRIIYELSIPKGKVLYLKDVEGRTFDSTLILGKTHTVKELINALNSPTIKARFERIKCGIASRNIPKKGHDHSFKNELKFLDLLISGQITELLEQTLHPDLNIAQSAFDELKQLWPWKDKQTFLGRSLKSGTGEPGFTANVGVDVMKIAEKNLITRPDYIAKHANAQEQKTIQEYREKCYQLQQGGNDGALFNQREQLYRCINENGNKNDLVTNVCLAIAENCWLDPITTVFRSIIHEPSLEKACDHLKNLEKQIIIQAEQHSIIPMNEIRTWVIDYYGFDVLDAAQNCYKSRSDYVYTPDNQSYLSDTIKPILSSIESNDLQGAHAELVNLEKQIDKAFEELNITDLIAQKEYIKKSFGKDVREIAQKTYEARSDYKELVTSFMAIDVNQATMTILENNNSYESVANEMSDLAKHVFANAHHCNLSNLPTIESHVYNSIDAMRTAQDHPTFIFNFSMVSHTLGDIQQLAHAILSGRHPVLERSSELLTRGFDKFFRGLNPITQVSNIGHLASDLGSFLKKGGIALWNDPITITHNGITSVFTLTELIRNTADFTSDLTVGKLYLSPEEYKQRIDTFCEIMEPLQGVTAEHCTDFVAQVAADVVFCKGLGNAYTFLKEVDVLGKLGKSAAAVARTFKKGFDTHLANNPIVVTTEGVIFQMSNDLKNIGGAAKEIITDSKTLLENTTAVESATAGAIDTSLLTDLKTIGNNTWKSPAGLIYKPDKKFGNRIQHVLAHAEPNSMKNLHTVFNVPKDEILKLIDEAWTIKGAPLISDSAVYIVDMKKSIGLNGESAIKIVVIPGTSEIITAYPVSL
jgi:hypothetical protein